MNGPQHVKEAEGYLEWAYELTRDERFDTAQVIAALANSYAILALTAATLDSQKFNKNNDAWEEVFERDGSS